MKRFAYNDLLKWKNSRFRKPLLLEGARQTGKTWLMKEFAKNEYQNVLYLNFEKDEKVKSFFGDNIAPERIISQLKGYFEIEISASDTLLILDEIQECQRAKDSLKYFNEDAPQYHIMAAGSFLGIAGGKFPVGQVERLTLRPLSFYEYLLATGQELRLEALCKYDKDLVASLASVYEEELKKYFYIGGMPKAVAVFIETGNLKAVRDIQNDILADYKDDFAKHINKNDIEKVRMIWDSVPKHLAKEKKKFMYREIKEGARSWAYENAMQWLTDTRLVYRVSKTEDPSLPLARNPERDAFKLYMLDTGLLSAKSNLEIRTFFNADYDVFNEFKGALAEQYVLQELIALGAEPFYWGRERGNAEIDFIIQYKNSIVPIEVKSGKQTKSKSLSVYNEKYKPKYQIRASLKNFGVAGNLCSIPLYMIESFKNILNNQPE
ncbi:MAG: DUF4143 domain-containing protein [Treponema sp.]|nr:DUF4143 domain-containing protein [Treponema sp.]